MFFVHSSFYVAGSLDSMLYSLFYRSVIIGHVIVMWLQMVSVCPIKSSAQLVGVSTPPSFVMVSSTARMAQMSLRAVSQMSHDHDNCCVVEVLVAVVQPDRIELG